MAAMDDSEARGNSAAAPAAADAIEASSGGGLESGEPTFPNASNDYFECCVCLDLIYKPIVLACGHVSCFWCVHIAMDGVRVSRCPICRQPYKYFPAICQVLHNLLQKMESAAYKRREKEVLEMENKWNCFSPQFIDDVTEDTVFICTPPAGQSTSTVIDAPQGNGGADKDNSKIECVNMDVSDIDGHVTIKDGKLPEGGRENESSQEVCISDARCSGCRELLFQPVVLNCGHVYCKPCMLSLGNETPRCQVCQSVHPGDLPKVCLQLSNFLEKKFPKEYALQREPFKDLSSRGCEANKHDSKLENHNWALSWEDMSKIHAQVGCDSCGMYPIMGKRYKCNDCKESVGFDLCEGCYNTRSKLPARFNQQHKPDHTFVLDETRTLANLYTRVRTQDFSEDFSGDSAETETLNDGAQNS